MICYRDMTFCNHGKGCTCPPRRRLTQMVWEAATNAGLPVSQADLCGTLDAPKKKAVKRRRAKPC